jgi:magnesium-protoporphyrin O-methyltransferase
VSCEAHCQGHCQAATTLFDAAVATRDLDRYRRRGPSPSTRRLLDAVRETGRSVESVLDVGGGVGAIVHELLAGGAARATLVDASPSYLAAAREEAERRGTTDRLELRRGDLVDVADDVPPADVVTLDKVVCCYPDMEALVAASAARARRLYGLVLPYDGWWVRLAIAVENGVRRWKHGDAAFTGYVHSNAAIDAALRRAGFVRRARSGWMWWVVAVYERVDR